MSQLEYMRLFANQRLTAALEEILSVFENVLVKYERDAAQCREVISRQHALLSTLHQPLREWDAPLTDCLTQPSSGKESTPCQPKDEVPDLEVVKEELEEQQLHKLHNLEIIGFTYHSKPAAKTQVDLQASAHPQTLKSDPDVQNVSSETEDSDDYHKESAGSGAAKETFSCRACSRTFRTRRSLFRHVRGHHQGEDPTLHLQAHFEKKKLQIQTRSQNREKQVSKLHEGSLKRNKYEEMNGSADARETRKKQRTP